MVRQLIGALLVALTLTGCMAHPEPGAGEYEVVGAYGKPDRVYLADHELVMEWWHDGEWATRCRFENVQTVTTSDGETERAERGKVYEHARAISFKWVLRSNDWNRRHSFYRD